MSDYRFRVEGALLVLQVKDDRGYNPYYGRNDCNWRDATVEDIPVFSPFTPPQPDKTDGAEYGYAKPVVRV